MKKSQLIITLVLISSIVATYAVYELYVKVRYTELKDHQTEEKNLRRKIADLNKTFYGTKPEEGRYDAIYGLMLEPSGNHNYRVVQPKQSGFFIKGDVRSLQVVNSVNGKKLVIVAKNNDSLRTFIY